MKYIDTHAHLNDPIFAEDLADVLLRASDAGVDDIVVVGYDLASAQHAQRLAEAHTGLWATVGVHPHDAPEANDLGLAQLGALVQQPKVIGIGEIGLDYYWNTWPKDQQQESFRRQIDLAKQCKLPFIVHDRDAHGDVLNLLREQAPYEKQFIMHCFSGSVEFAKDCIRLGGYISLAGPVTFRNAAKLLDVAREVPLERLLVETDCPYLAPDPHRGKRNEPSYVPLVVAAIARQRGVEAHIVGESLVQNSRLIFGLGEKR